MVKELLREQHELKEQLNGQENQTKKPVRGVRAASKPGGLYKKASERVPRQDLRLNIQRSADAEKANPREHLNVPLQVKPFEKVDPRDNKKQQLTRKNMLERRRKEKQEQDAQKISAIEQKIENARVRLELQKKMKSQKAKNVVKSKIQGLSSQQDHHPNADLEDYGYEDMVV
jgi:hypothetical protein